MKVNLKDYDMPDFENQEPVPSGWYQVEIIKAEKIEKDGKSPYVSTWFKIVEGMHSGRYIFHNFIFTEKAIGFMKPLLLAINYSSDEEIEIEPSEWEGEQLMLLIGHRIWNGKKKEEAVAYKSLESEGKSLIKSDEKIPFE